MPKATPALALVTPEPAPQSAADRVKAAAAVAKAEAAAAQEEMVQKIESARDTAAELSLLDTYADGVRDQMRKFVSAANSVLDTFTRPTR